MIVRAQPKISVCCPLSSDLSAKIQPAIASLYAGEFCWQPVQSATLYARQA